MINQPRLANPDLSLEGPTWWANRPEPKLLAASVARSSW
jgi:hypothetical protein